MAYEQVDQNADIEMGLGPEAPQSPSLRERFDEFTYQSYESFRGAAESQLMRNSLNTESRVKNRLPGNGEGWDEDEYDINALLRSEDTDSATCAASDVAQESDGSSTQPNQSERAESVMSSNSSSDTVLITSIPSDSDGNSHGSHDSHDSHPLPTPTAAPSADNDAQNPQPPPIYQADSNTHRATEDGQHRGERATSMSVYVQSEVYQVLWICAIFIFLVCCSSSIRKPDDANTPETQ